MDPVQRGMGDWFNKRPSLAADDRDIGDWFRQKPLSQTAATSANDAEIDSWTAPAQRSRHEADWFRAQPSDVDSSAEIADWFRSRPRDSGAGRSSPQPESGAARSSAGFFRSAEPMPKPTPRTDTDSSQLTVRFAEEDQTQKQEKNFHRGAALRAAINPAMGAPADEWFEDKDSSGDGDEEKEQSQKKAPSQKEEQTRKLSRAEGREGMVLTTPEGVRQMKDHTTRDKNPSAKEYTQQMVGPLAAKVEAYNREQARRPPMSAQEYVQHVRNREQQYADGEPVHDESANAYRHTMLGSAPPEGWFTQQSPQRVNESAEEYRERVISHHVSGAAAPHKMPSAADYTKEMLGPLVAQLEEYNSQHSHKAPESASEYRHRMLLTQASASYVASCRKGVSSPELHQSASEYRERMLSDHSGAVAAHDRHVPSSKEYTEGMVAPLIKQLEEYNRQQEQSYVPPESSHTYCKRMISSGGNPSLNSADGMRQMRADKPRRQGVMSAADHVEHLESLQKKGQNTWRA